VVSASPWAQLARAVEAVAIELDTADPGKPIPVPGVLLRAYCAAHEARRDPGAAA
jgi:hypothetical protein